MEVALKAKWVEALKSKKFEQGQGSLHKVGPTDIHKFCCLGVLCEVAGIKSEATSDFYSYDGNQSVLTKKLRDQLGLDTIDTDQLITMNDGPNSRTFAHIASWIERNL